MAENATLEESIKTAVTENPLPGTEAQTDAKEEARTETKEEKVETPEGDKPSETTELEQAQAIQLFRALKDPNAAPQIIDWLASRAGYAKIETKQEAKEVKADIVSVLKEKLGPDLDYLAEKLGPVIESVVNEKVQENTKDLRVKQQENETKELANEANVAMTKLAKVQLGKDELPDDILEDMNKLMDKIDPSPNMSVSEYVEHIYFSVAGRRGLKATTPAIEEKRTKNRNDAPSRIASEGRRAQPVPGSETPANFTDLGSAIRAAMQKIAEDEG